MSDEISSSVTTKELRLVDNDGRDRAVLAIDANGAVALKFSDQSGKTRTQIGINDSGQALIELGRGEGVSSLAITVDPDGRVMVDGRDNEGVERFKLQIKGDGSHTELSFHEKYKKPRMVLIAEDKGPAGLFILDHNGKALFSTQP